MTKEEANTLDQYFTWGKMFKPGTRQTSVPTPDMMRDEYRGEHRPTPKKKPAPKLKPQSLYEYAFLVGTLCSIGTKPPSWKPLMPVLARADAYIPSDDAMKVILGGHG